MTPERVHGAKNLAKIEATLRRNRASTYTEEMTRLHQGFRYADHADQPWHVEQLSLFWGSPIWEQATTDQRRALNHLWWVAFYQLVSGAERQTILANQLCAAALFPLGGYDALCLELDLETTQERHHIRAFAEIGRATEAALLGGPVFVPVDGERAPDLVGRSTQALARVRSEVGQTVASVFFARLTRSPFLATQYFLLRSFFNFVAKQREALGYELHRVRTQAGEPIAAPLGVIHFHYLDEAFHTSVSHLVSHELHKDLPPATPMEVRVMNHLVRRIQANILGHSGSAMAGSFGDDTLGLPHFYKVLRSPVFRMSHRDALTMLQRCFCQEHEGFHASGRFRGRFLETVRRATADLDYLSPENRDFTAMEAVKLEDVIARNRRSFDRFARRQKDEVVSA